MFVCVCGIASVTKAIKRKSGHSVCVCVKAYFSIERPPGYRDVFRTAVSIKVFTSTAGTDVARVVALETLDESRSVGSGQERILTICFLKTVHQ